MMYKRLPTQIALAAFPDDKEASAAAEALAKALVGEPIVCTNLAVVSKDKSSKVKVAEYGKNGPLNGFVAGGVGGTVVGGMVGGLALCLLGPVGIAVGGSAGALVGATVGAVNGTVVGAVTGVTVESMSKKNLNALSDCLEPGSSVLVAFFGEVTVKKSEFQKLYKENKDGTDALIAMTGQSISSALKDQKIFGTAFSVDEEGVAATHTLIGDDGIDIAALLLTPEGGFIAEAGINEEGEAAIAGLVASKDEGIFAGGALANEEALIYEAAAVQKTDDDGMEVCREVGAMVAAETDVAFPSQDKESMEVDVAAEAVPYAEFSCLL